MKIKVPTALVRELRQKLRDFPERNYLHEDEESDDQQLARALHEALESYNLIPPILDDEVNFTTIPTRAVRLIVDLAVPIIISEVMIWMARNEFQYQAGNTSVRLYDKWRAYQTISAQLEAKAERMIARWKYKLNIDNAWGQNLTELFDPGWERELGDFVVLTI